MKNIENLNEAYSCWLVASARQRPERMASKYGLRLHPHMHGFIFITIEKWSTIPTGFFEVYEAIKRFQRKYPDYAEKYTIVVHGKANSPSKTQIRYMMGATIHYNSFSGEIKISHVNRQVRPIIDLVNNATHICPRAQVEVEKLSSEEVLANARKRMLRRRVLNL